MNPQAPNPAGYEGNISAIPLGKTGLFTDAAQVDIPKTGLIRANNVTYYNQVVQKDNGSRIWNNSPLPASIVEGKEMFVDSQSLNQRIFALCANGQIYKFNNPATQTEITPQTGAPSSLFTANYNCMVVGGNEQPGNPKKLFTFNGYNPPQVISGDTTIRYNISLPPGDWTGTYQPFGGVMHRGSLYVWGNQNLPHCIYSSNATNHEDFQTVGATATYNIYPGEYQGIVAALDFRGVLYAFKYPCGIYYLVDTDSNPSNWYFTKQSDDFGAASPQSLAVAFNDMFIANNYGSISSMLASLVFGNTLNSDLFHSQGCFRFAEDEVRPDIVLRRHMVYYAKKKQLMCTFQSTSGTENDRIAVVDFKDPNNVPKVAFLNKDQANCLFLVSNNVKVPKPFYGSSDGNLYEMDVPDKWVGVGSGGTQTPYLFDIQTPHMDFSQDGIVLSIQVKTFEFLTLQYEPTGDFDCQIDLFIDQKFVKTYTCNMSGRSNLSEMPLDSSVVDGLGTFSRRITIHGEGSTISLRFYNNGLGQDIRLVRAYIWYRLSGQQQMIGR